MAQTNTRSDKAILNFQFPVYNVCVLVIATLVATNIENYYYSTDTDTNKILWMGKKNLEQAPWWPDM